MLTLPSLSEALAVIVMLAGAVKEAPLLGEVRLTLGGVLEVLPVTLMLSSVAVHNKVSL